MSEQPAPLSSSAKWAVGFGLVTFASTVTPRLLFAIADLFTGAELRDGWFAVVIAVGGGCLNTYLGICCGCAALISALIPMRSENPKDRNAARFSLALVGLAVLSVFWGQLRLFSGEAP